MQTRIWSSGAYRFGFNGKEEDDELNVDGGSYDFGARIYDGRLGRFVTIDPHWKRYQYVSTYVYCSNQPLLLKDEDGRDNVIYIVQAQNSDCSYSVDHQEIQKMANEMNAALNAMGINNVTVVYFNTKFPGQQFHREEMASTDAIIYIGKPESVKAMDQADNTSNGWASSETSYNTPNGYVKEGWQGGKYDPEITRAQSIDQHGVVYIDSKPVMTKGGKIIKDYAAFLGLHGIGHYTDPNPCEGAACPEDHVDVVEKNSGKAVPNVMMSGPFLQKYFTENRNAKTSDTYKAKNRFNNLFTKRLKDFFKSKQAIVNYGKK